MFPQHLIILGIPAKGQRFSQGHCSAEAGIGPRAGATLLLRKGLCALFEGKEGKMMRFRVIKMLMILKSFGLVLECSHMKRSFVPNQTELNITLGVFHLNYF